MKEGIFHGGPPGEASINIIDSPIPEPKDDEVLIKVIFSGIPNPIHTIPSPLLTSPQGATQRTGNTPSSRRRT
jgi:hypothetical protein